MAQILLPTLRLAPAAATATTSIQNAKSPLSRRGAPRPVEPLSRALRDAGSVLLRWRGGLTSTESEEGAIRDARKQVLQARLRNADTWKQWDKAAHELDILEGNEEWKKDDLAGDYHPELILARLMALDEARAAGDLHAMMHLVRTALTRDLGGMGNLDLYSHSHCGTKKLIDRYVDSALQTINSLVEHSAHGLPQDLEPKDLLDAVLSARQSFGRSALLLSGGGTFGMAHIGVLKAMHEVKLLPRIISGASAGSIVCAVVCTRTDDEVPQLLSEFPHGDLAVFEEEGNEDGIMDHARRLLTQGNWSDIKHLTRVMRNMLGDITFQEAYNRTRRICNICVSPASIYELPRLLNYVTAPNVMIWSAVAASCSVPLVFSAAPLLIKNPWTGEHSPWNPSVQMWIDGSVDNDLPMTRLAEMFNVNHFIVSQVNPHVVPFLAKEGPPTSSQTQTQTQTQATSRPFSALCAVGQLAKDEALHRMQQMAECNILPNLFTKLRAVLNQTYSGDINILPAMGLLDLPKILTNPTSEFMLRSCLIGERATWPKISRIRDRCAIELALDRAVHALRAGVVFSKSQIDLRRSMVTGATDSMRSLRGAGHEPLSSITGLNVKEKLRRRQRRSSGSSVHPAMVHGHHLCETDKIADADTSDEERLELSSRRSPSRPKMKIRRFPGHCPCPLQSGPRTTPSLTSFNEPDPFDFALYHPAMQSPNAAQTSTGAGVFPPAVKPLGRDESDMDADSSSAAVDDACVTPPALEANATCFDEPVTDPSSSDADVGSQPNTGAGAAGKSVRFSELDTPVVEQEWLHQKE